jgi:hypothetical protein
LTKEHLWPDWLRRYVNDSTKWNWRLVDDVDGEISQELDFTRRAYEQQVRAVCADCNGGWMSEIEAAAKPILISLLEETSCSLKLEAQETLATWALLKAIMFDELHRRERVVLAEHRAYLYERRAVPSVGAWAWLAAYDAEQIGHYAYQGLLLMESGDTAPVDPTAYAVTLSAGSVVLQVAGTSLASLSLGESLDPYAGVVRIWPASAPVEHRPHSPMTTETLLAFSTAVYDELRTRSWPPAKPAL